MAPRIFERAKVDDQGRISGLDAHKGEEFILVKTPKLGALGEAGNLEKPREIVDEVFRYVKEHRELAGRQYNEFTTRYGRPEDKFRELASHLTPEEFARRTKEIAEFAERRLAEVRKDVEATYARVEKEIEARAGQVLGRGKENPAVVTLDEQAAAGSIENRREREF